MKFAKYSSQYYKYRGLIIEDEKDWQFFLKSVKDCDFDKVIPDFIEKIKNDNAQWEKYIVKVMNGRWNAMKESRIPELIIYPIMITPFGQFIKPELMDVKDTIDIDKGSKVQLKKIFVVKKQKN